MMGKAMENRVTSIDEFKRRKAKAKYLEEKKLNIDVAIRLKCITRSISRIDSLLEELRGFKR